MQYFLYVYISRNDFETLYYECCPTAWGIENQIDSWAVHSWYNLRNEFHMSITERSFEQDHSRIDGVKGVIACVYSVEIKSTFQLGYKFSVIV